METSIKMSRDDLCGCTRINIVLSHNDMARAYNNLDRLDRMVLEDGEKTMTATVENIRIWMKAIEATTPDNKTGEGE